LCENKKQLLPQEEKNTYILSYSDSVFILHYFCHMCRYINYISKI